MPTRPAPKRVSSDDCVVTIDGSDYTIHQGEWVDVLLGITVGELRMMQKMQRLRAELDAIDGMKDEDEKRLVLLSDAYADAITVLHDRIHGWSWTDRMGKPYPCPQDDISVFNRLSPDEVLYLVSVIEGRSPGQLKNA